MATTDLDRFRKALPDLFLDMPLPERWEEDWIRIPVAKPDATTLTEAEASLSLLRSGAEHRPLPAHAGWADGALAPSLAPLPRVPFPDFKGAFPGAPLARHSGSAVPPPDEMAFYLPFHYYHPKWWGVYLTFEGVNALAADIRRRSGGRLPEGKAVSAARLFLYSHAAFHHKVESFAARLETTHRIPLYRTGFAGYFERTKNTSNDLVPPLSLAYAFQKTKRMSKAVRSALKAYICGLPGGKRAISLFNESKYKSASQGLCERLHHESLSAPMLDPAVWRVFSHALTGIGRVNSRVNYIIHRASPLAERLDLHGRM